MIGKPVTASNVARKSVTITCEECLESYEATLTAYGTAVAEAVAKDDPALAARARGNALRNLEQQAPVEPCPRCGTLQAAMVRRLFEHPMHAGARRRHDDSPATVNSPYARAVRLVARHVSVDEIRERIAVDDEDRELWDALLMAFVTDDVYTAVDGRFAAFMAGLSEGERLAYFLRRRRGLSPGAASAALQNLYGADEATARIILSRLKQDRDKGEGSAGLMAAGLVLVLVTGLAAFVLGIAVPFFKSALAPKPVAEEELRIEMPMPRAWASPTGREDQGPRPVGSSPRRDR